MFQSVFQNTNNAVDASHTAEFPFKNLWKCIHGVWSANSEGWVVGNNSQNSSKIYHLTCEGFWNSLAFIVIVRLSFAFSIMLLKTCCSVVVPHPCIILSWLWGHSFFTLNQFSLDPFTQGSLTPSTLTFVYVELTGLYNKETTWKLKNSMFCYKRMTIF